MWNDYKVTGLAIKYRPYTFDLAGPSAIIRQRLACGTTMNNVVTGGQLPEKMVGFLDTKTYDPSRPFKRFYRVGKWWNQQMERNYRLTEDVPVAFNTDFNCTTSINLQCSTTYADDFPVGDVEVTWYLKFKTRKNAFA